MATRQQSAVTDTNKTLVEIIAARTRAITLHEFADLMNMSYQTVWAMAKDRRLPVMRIGSSIRMDPKSTANWLRERSAE
jgi:excisionase family DNA binding protein